MVWVADVPWIWHCCGCDARLAGAAPIQPLAWELPYASGVTLKHTHTQIKNKEKVRIVSSRHLLHLKGMISFTNSDISRQFDGSKRMSIWNLDLSQKVWAFCYQIYSVPQIRITHIHGRGQDNPSVHSVQFPWEGRSTQVLQLCTSVLFRCLISNTLNFCFYHL